MLQTYVLIVSPCFSMLQLVLLPTCSDSWASKRCTRYPYNTRRGPLWWSMQSAQHMCMRTVLPSSLWHWGARAMLSLALGHTHYDSSLSLACNWGLSRIRARTLCSLSLALG